MDARRAGEAGCGKLLFLVESRSLAVTLATVRDRLFGAMSRAGLVVAAEQADVIAFGAVRHNLGHPPGTLTAGRRPSSHRDAPAFVGAGVSRGCARLLAMVADLEQRALAAAGAVAAAHGLSPNDAVVTYSGSNVLVHLRPAPVLARVMTGTVTLHDDPQRWLERELSVLEFLAPSGLAVSPSRLIEPGPHRHDGLWMTFTEWIPEVEPDPKVNPAHLDDARRLGRTLRDLHDELRSFAGELGGLRELREDIERLLGQLRPADAQESDAISSLREQLDMLRTVVFESRLPTQALHGDVSLRNLLRSPRRLVWNDFEDTFRGPVHWDVASYVGSLRIHGASARFVQEMLNGYGWGDEEELAPFLAAQDVYDEIWRMYDRQRRRS